MGIINFDQKLNFHVVRGIGWVLSKRDEIMCWTMCEGEVLNENF